MATVSTDTQTDGGGEKVSRVERSDDGDGWKSRARKERQSDGGMEE